MSKLDRDKWDRRYADSSYRRGNPVTLLQEWLPRLAVGKALDVACGAGRNAIAMARAGFRVDAIDISGIGLELARKEAASLDLDINWIEHDLEQPYDFDTDYDLIVVLWYVNLPLIARLGECLKPGGYLLCEEHLVAGGELAGPENPRFRVAPGALETAAEGLDVMLYEETASTNDNGEPMASARLVARKP
jgi:SAM-dependent methyltransferase